MEIAFDQNNDGMISEEEANFYLSGHENYDQESFLSTGWLLMKHLFSTYESGNNKNDNDAEDIDSEVDEHETTKDPLDEGSEDYDYDEFDDEKDIPDDELEAPSNTGAFSRVFKQKLISDIPYFLILRKLFFFGSL